MEFTAGAGRAVTDFLRSTVAARQIRSPAFETRYREVTRRHPSCSILSISFPPTASVYPFRTIAVDALPAPHRPPFHAFFGTSAGHMLSHV